MEIIISAIVVKTYEIATGEYLGCDYKNQEFVAMQPQKPGEENRQRVIAFRVKGAILDRFLSEGINKDGRVHKFHLVFDCKEVTWQQDGSIHPVNKIPICVGWDEVDG